MVRVPIRPSTIIVSLISIWICLQYNKYNHFDDHEEQDDQGGTHFAPDHCVPESWGAFDTNSSGVVLVFANPDHMALVIEAEVLPTAPPATPPVVASGEGGEVAAIPVALPEGLACSLNHDELRILNVGLLDWDALANIFHQRLFLWVDVRSCIFHLY